MTTAETIMALLGLGLATAGAGVYSGAGPALFVAGAGLLGLAVWRRAS